MRAAHQPPTASIRPPRLNFRQPLNRFLPRFLILLAVAVAAHGVILRNGFVWWDDAHTISGNHLINPPSVAGLEACWLRVQGDLYAPVTYSAWWLISLVTNVLTDEPTLSPLGFHLASLIVHAIACVALLSLLTRIVGDGRAALWGAMVYAAHPVQVETIAWASGLKDAMCGMFVICALRAYLATVDERGARQWTWWGASMALVLGGMLSKATAVVAPVLAIGVDRATGGRRWGQTLGWVVPWLVLAVPVALIAGQVQHPVRPGLEQSQIHRVLIAGDAVTFYLRKIVLPTSLGVDYGRRPDVIVARLESSFIWIVPVIVALAAAGLLRHRAVLRRQIVAAVILFLGPLLPVLGFVPFDFQQNSTVADHYLYLPMAGVALAIAALVAHARANAGAVQQSFPENTRGAAFGWLVIVALVLLSIRQSQTWHDTDSLFAQALVANSTSWAAYDSLADVQIEQKNYSRALDLAAQAARFGPRVAEPQITLGLIHSRLGDDAAAAEALESAVAIEPDNAAARVDLGIVRGRQGDVAAAIEQLSRGVALDPLNLDARLALASLLARAGRPAEALAHLDAAVEMAPRSAAAHGQRAAVLLQLHREDEAGREQQEAARLGSENGSEPHVPELSRP